jgi:hypothetical protein
MPVRDTYPRSVRQRVLSGALVGGLAGFVVEPIFVVAWMWRDSLLFGNAPFMTGSELIIAPIFGGFFGTLEGAAIGLVWVSPSRRLRQLKVRKLALGLAIMTIAGPLLVVLVLALLYVAFTLFGPVIFALLENITRMLVGHTPVAIAIAIITIACLVFPRRDASRLKNEEKKRSSLSKGLPIYDRMSEWVMGFRRRPTKNPCFFDHSSSRSAVPGLC